MTVSELATTAPGAATPEQASIDRTIRARQLKLLFDQWIGVPAPLLILCVAIGYLVWDYSNHVHVLAWVALNVGAPLARMWVCRRWFGSPEAIDARWRAAHALAYSTVLSGLWTGAAAPLFFADLPIERQAILGYILACAGAGAVASSGAYPPAFFGFAAPLIAQIIWAWETTDAPAKEWVIVLLVLIFAVLGRFVRDNGRTVEESIRIRFERESLLREKESLIEQLEEANLSKSRFLAAASHDLRQPLHALSLLTALLNSAARDPHMAEVGRQIDRSVQSLDNLFTALLDLSRLDAGVVVPAPVELRFDQFLEGIAAEYRYKAAQKQLAFELRTEPCAVRADPILLERIVRNLLENAIRYTPRGTISLWAERRGADAVIGVDDTGVGIPAAEHGRVFDEFYQLGNPERDRAKGLGLGLAIVKRLALLMKAEVGLESNPGEGSRFSVTLRDAAAALAPADSDESGEPVAEVSVTGASVLVIEDDALVRDALRLALAEWGCVPLVASGLDEARTLVCGAGRAPDLIVSDLRLRDGASGIDAIAALRRELGACPALIVTGDTGNERLQELQKTDDPVLHKPVDFRVLKRTMRDLLRDSRRS